MPPPTTALLLTSPGVGLTPTTLAKAAGTRLEQFYVQPVCSPTRASFLTGRYPMRYGLHVGVVRPWAAYGLPLDERLLPRVDERHGGIEPERLGELRVARRPELLHEGSRVEEHAALDEEVAPVGRRDEVAQGAHARAAATSGRRSARSEADRYSCS